MELIINIKMDGAAFDSSENEAAAGDEVRRILHQALANGYCDYPCPATEFSLRDINGNVCGSVRVEERWKGKNC
jgi:hypothetical protein